MRDTLINDSLKLIIKVDFYNEENQITSSKVKHVYDLNKEYMFLDSNNMTWNYSFDTSLASDNYINNYEFNNEIYDRVLTVRWDGEWPNTDSARDYLIEGIGLVDNCRWVKDYSGNFQCEWGIDHYEFKIEQGTVYYRESECYECMWEDIMPSWMVKELQCK